MRAQFFNRIGLGLLQRCGRLDDQISLLKHKLQLIHQGHAFNGKRTKTARSQGRKFQVTLEQEATRLLVSLSLSLLPFKISNSVQIEPPARIGKNQWRNN